MLSRRNWKVCLLPYVVYTSSAIKLRILFNSFNSFSASGLMAIILPFDYSRVPGFKGYQCTISPFGCYFSIHHLELHTNLCFLPPNDITGCWSFLCHLWREKITNNAIETHLLRKSVYSACRMSPVLIMMVWKHWRSMAQRRQSVAALMVAVRLQLYSMASSPNTLPGAIVLRYLFSLDTSTRPSVDKEDKMTLFIESL